MRRFHLVMKRKTFSNLLVVCGLAAVAFAHAGAPKTSLYERIGIHRLAAASYMCIQSELMDPVLLENPIMAARAKDAPLSYVQYSLTSYLGHLTGGPQVPAMDIAAFERGLMLTTEQRAHAWEVRESSFMKAGVSKEDFEELRKLYEAQYAKAKPMGEPKMETFKDKDSLYARLGGIVPITLVINDFIDMLAADPVQLGNPNVVKSLTAGHVTAQGLKYLVSEQIAQAAGGPFKYSGRSMKESHKGLMISDKEWDSAAGILKSVLDKYHVPAKEQGEVFGAISATKGDIVGG